MAERSRDWITQANRDLIHAKSSVKMEDYEWSCFAAEQAAEKALKAVYEKNNRSVKGHSVYSLLKGLSAQYPVEKALLSQSRIVSRYYIDTRYPNGFPEGAPFEYFDETIAMEAIYAAEKILEWCRDIIDR
jgi:HEPN domain-containing protein